MSPDVPRRLPPSQDQRQANINRSRGGQSGDGAVRAARPVSPGQTQRIYAPHAGGAIIGSVYYTAPTPGFGYNDFTDPPFETGDTSCFGPYDTALHNVPILTTGAYSAWAQAHFNSLGTARVAEVRLQSSQFFYLSSYVYGLAAPKLSVHAPIQQVFIGDEIGPVQALITTVGAGPTVDLCELFIVRWDAPGVEA